MGRISFVLTKACRIEPSRKMNQAWIQIFRVVLSYNCCSDAQISCKGLSDLRNGRMDTDTGATIKHPLQSLHDSVWNSFTMKITFEERKTQSEPHPPVDKMAPRPATPFPSPSLKGQDRVRKFLESQRSIANTRKQDAVELSEKPKSPNLT